MIAKTHSSFHYTMSFEPHYNEKSPFKNEIITDETTIQKMAPA